MKSEYDAIAAAGIVLQVDCPDLAMARDIPLEAVGGRQAARREGPHTPGVLHSTTNYV
jgi:5-methyltetrahydropteroyltriglutamate--homocysteine methyltransferase